jgi:hypothetical protein
MCKSTASNGPVCISRANGALWTVMALHLLISAYWRGYESGIKQAERHNKTREGKLWAKLESETCSLYQSTTWNHYKPNVKRSSRYLTRATAIMQKLAALEAK